MGFKAGIVGLPNVGKSTLFNALTSAGVPAENYPFCTIDPSVGIVKVPDGRLAAINKFIETEKIVPAVIEVVDIAGLVAGASKGEGLGNKFLAHIRETNAILEVVRCFNDPNVIHVHGKIDPIGDIGVIELELMLADLFTVEKRCEQDTKAAKSGNKLLILKAEAERKIKDALAQEMPARSVALTEPEAEAVRDLHLITMQPVLYVCNISEADIGKPNPLVDIVCAHAKKTHSGVIVVCASVEAEISTMPEGDRADFLQSVGLKESGLEQLGREGYSLLGLQSYFTAGPKEIKAWTIRKGDKAPQAAGVIHTDFEKGFIRAEVYTVADLEQYKSETAIRDSGKLRVEGKEYVVADGDIMHFRFNV